MWLVSQGSLDQGSATQVRGQKGQLGASSEWEGEVWQRKALPTGDLECEIESPEEADCVKEPAAHCEGCGVVGYRVKGSSLYVRKTSRTGACRPKSNHAALGPRSSQWGARPGSGDQGVHGFQRHEEGRLVGIWPPIGSVI